MCDGVVVTLKPHIRQMIMTRPSAHEVTQLLQAWGEGDERALEKLTPLVYGELHQLAQRYMAREAPGHTLQTPTLVHEVYLRLVEFREISWQNRAYFFGVCARLMRQILVDFARSGLSVEETAEVLRGSEETILRDWRLAKA